MYKCPLRKTVNIVERNEEKEGIFLEIDGDREEGYKAYEGHTNVVRWTTLSPRN